MSAEERGRLETALVAAAAVIDVPATPPIAVAVRSRLTAAPTPARRRFTPAFAFAAACLIGLVGVLTFSPAARDAVADFLGVDGIRIGPGEKDPSLDLGLELDLGRGVTAAEADTLVEFPVRVFHSEDLGAPDGYFFAEPPAGGAISIVYRASSELPEVGDTGVGLLLTQFEGRPDEGYFKKLHEVEEPLEFVTVNGAPGYWIADVHELLYYDRDGELREDESRLAGSTLVWEYGGVTYRLESALTKEEAVRYANTVS
jgi:hypothetical protein